MSEAITITLIICIAVVLVFLISTIKDYFLEREREKNAKDVAIAKMSLEKVYGEDGSSHINDIDKAFKE